jgi:hypothetical protein
MIVLGGCGVGEDAGAGRTAARVAVATSFIKNMGSKTSIVMDYSLVQ